MESVNHIQYLLQRYLDDLATLEEKEELFALVRTNMNDEEWAILLQPLGVKQERDINYQPEKWQSVIENILKNNSTAGRRGAVINLFSSMPRVFRWLSAASILLILGIGAYLWNNSPRTAPKETIVKASGLDILPGKEKATLTLSDGRVIQLDSVVSGQLAIEGDAGIFKDKNGRIVYNINGVANNKVVMNTMSTPRGGQYQLILPDGSHVWLNAGSSITYPVVFVSDKREVSVTGEVYFEVVKNKSKPFIVKSGKDEVTVLGTSFNINSYLDEPHNKISLIEGSIKVNEKILKPGQAFTDGKIIATNIAQDMAWKNGVFDFSGADLSRVMRDISRWYDIEVKYKSNQFVQPRFLGKLSRDLTLQQMLETLKDIGVRFTLSGRTLTVQ